MVSVIEDIFAYDFLVNAFVACLLSGVTCGIVGSYVVARRMVFLSGGVTHASFGGLGIALYYGANPVVGALIFAVISSMGIEFASRRGGIREDSAIGIVWSAGMALGALFMAMRPGYATDLTSYLFGNILLVSFEDNIYLALLAVAVVVGAFALLRRLMYVTFDEEYARSQGVAVGVAGYVMSAIVAVTIVFSIKVMGIVLLMSLITIPAVIAGALTKDFRYIALWASIIAVISNVTGFIISYTYDLPTGSCVIFMLIGALIVVKLLTLPRRKGVVA